MSKHLKLTPDVILQAYSKGIFPMAESRNQSKLFWIDPDIRGIFPLNGLHISRSLKKAVRQRRFEIRYNTDFKKIIKSCASTNQNRKETWINDEIIRLYTELHNIGHAHSVECWNENRLMGGLYGISIRSAFFGESMFSYKTDASKIALVHLVARLNEDGFTLLDAQFLTNHLKSLGAIEISRNDYLKKLDHALKKDAKFNANGSQISHQHYVEKLLKN